MDAGLLSGLASAISTGLDSYNDARARQRAQKVQDEQLKMQRGGLIKDGLIANADTGEYEMSPEVKARQDREAQIKELNIEQEGLGKGLLAEYDEQGRIRHFKGGGVDKKQAQQNFSNTAELRKEYNSQPQTKSFTEVQSAFSKIKNAAKDPSPAGDMAMLYSYMKILDPGSTVREGEFSTAGNTGNLPTQIQNYYNKLKTGERLTPEQRADFLKSAKNTYLANEDQLMDARTRYSELARGQGFAEKDVIGKFDRYKDEQEVNQPPAPKEGAQKTLAEGATQKQFNAALNKTRFVYADGTIKEVDGRQ